MQLDQLCEQYLSVRTKIRSDRTREHYRRSVAQFSDHLCRSATIEDLTDDALSAFIISTVNAGFSPITANQRVKQLRALWNWAAKKRLVHDFPTFEDIDEPEPLPTAWTDDELTKLFAACANQRGWIGPHQASTWWLAIHWWWLSTAERTEATMLLRRDMLRLDQGLAVVPASIRKGRAKNRIYRLAPRCVELLAEMAKPSTPTGLVFDHSWRDWRSIFGTNLLDSSRIIPF